MSLYSAVFESTDSESSVEILSLFNSLACCYIIELHFQVVCWYKEAPYDGRDGCSGTIILLCG